ncbi:hypothetical protein E2C01_083141 [Portunus trituberculatus]|uniref:Uncharacterized protein n=1 Tax=Portunus trituberculatus TaxID=210409 RepID=A0A5B7IRP2_PORTR|nr:hypothetical protein [Portunus trituberculatus]
MVPAAVIGAQGSPGPHPAPHILLQSTSHPHKAKLVMMDQQGHMREALVNPVPHGYYPPPGPVPGSSSHPEGWSGRPQVSRDPLAPPLMFMGPSGMGVVARELAQPQQVQSGATRPPASRAMPPPLSFMGQSGETASWAGAQHSQQPVGMSWPHLVGHSSRTYPVINHTKHVIANKAPPSYFGPPPHYTPKSSYSIQRHLFQGQPHPNTPTSVAPRPNPDSRHHTLDWPATAVPQATSHSQQQHHRVTAGTKVHRPSHTDAVQVSSEHHSRPRQPAVVHRDTSRHQAADPGVTAPSSAGPVTASSATSTSITTTTTTNTPSTSTDSVEKHQCHQKCELEGLFLPASFVFTRWWHI